MTALAVAVNNEMLPGAAAPGVPMAMAGPLASRSPTTSARLARFAIGSGLRQRDRTAVRSPGASATSVAEPSMKRPTSELGGHDQIRARSSRTRFPAATPTPRGSSTVSGDEGRNCHTVSDAQAPPSTAPNVGAPRSARPVPGIRPSPSPGFRRARRARGPSASARSPARGGELRQRDAGRLRRRRQEPAAEDLVRRRRHRHDDAGEIVRRGKTRRRNPSPALGSGFGAVSNSRQSLPSTARPSTAPRRRQPGASPGRASEPSPHC